MLGERHSANSKKHNRILLEEMMKDLLSKCRRNTKVGVLQSAIVPVLKFEAQTWTLTKRVMEKVRVTQFRIERSIIGLRRDDEIINSHERKGTHGKCE